MARVILALNREEVEAAINYRLICEAMCSEKWQTTRLQKAWAEKFTESERAECYRMKAQAYKWYLRTGVPEEIEMTTGTLALWKKLEAFCATI